MGTPLHAAAKCGKPQQVVLLLQHGADVGATDTARAASVAACVACCVARRAMGARVAVVCLIERRAAAAPPPAHLLQAGATPLDVAADDITRAALRMGASVAAAPPPLVLLRGRR